jgi:hypothetical protein
MKQSAPMGASHDAALQRLREALTLFPDAPATIVERADLAALLGARDAAGKLVKAADRVRNYGETLSYECFECGGENEYWGIDIEDRNELAYAEQELSKLLPAQQPPAASPATIDTQGG